MSRKNVFFYCGIKGLCMVCLMVGMLAFLSSPAATQTVTHKINFISDVEYSETFDVPKGCPDPLVMTGASVTIGPLRMGTHGSLTNLSSGEANAVMIQLSHTSLRLAFVDPAISALVPPLTPEGTQLLPHSEGQNFSPCTGYVEPLGTQQANCAGTGPGNWLAGSFAFHFNSNADPPAPYRYFYTTADPKPYNIAPANFPLFKGSGNIQARMTVAAFRNLITAGSFQDNIITDANATITVAYVCAGQPGLSCVSKQMNPSQISGDTATITVTGRISNTGGVDITDLVIRDVMNSAKMTYSGGSNIGAPSCVSGTCTFPARTLSAGQNLDYTFQVQVSGLNQGETVCDQITAYSAQYFPGGVDGAQCNACVTRTQKVPALNTTGWMLLIAVVAISGLILIRRRLSA